MDKEQYEAMLTEVDLCDKYNAMYMCLVGLLSREKRNNIKYFIEKKAIKKIVLYGANFLARAFVDFIEKEKNSEIVGVIDRDNNTEFGFNEFITIESLKELDYDIVIITAFTSYREIEKILEDNGIVKHIFIQKMINYKELENFYESYIYCGWNIFKRAFEC